MIRPQAIALVILAVAAITSQAPVSGEMAEETFRLLVEADWERQEKRKGRTSADPAAIRDAVRRARVLTKDLSSGSGAIDTGRERDALDALDVRLKDMAALGETARRRLYHEVRWMTRGVALKNPLIASRPIVFLKRRRFICQMLHEYLGYYYDYEDISGGGVNVLTAPGRSMTVRNLIGSRLPRGNYTTLSLSHDAHTIYFAFAARAATKTEYYSQDRRCFHVFAVDSNGENLQQLTDGSYDDFDPCPLPDGDIAFMSTRRGGFGRCHNPWEPLPTYTLHRMNGDSTSIQTLSFHETNEWHPSVLHDGRIVYTRWDYVDRSAIHHHGLWTSNPDGTNPSSLFGNYTQRINACFQPRAIPGSNRIVFVAGAHHADVGGSLVVVDPARCGLDPATGEDRFDALEILTPEVCFPEAPGWPTSYFHSPWPLSENYYLVSFSFDPLPGMGPGVKEDTKTGIYLFDRFGNLELLYSDPDYSCMYPIPLAARPVPPVVPGSLDPGLVDEAELFLSDVNKSHFGLPMPRPIRRLRVFQVLPKSETHVANRPRLGYANAESGRMLLGTVPVAPDGSAYFRVPARKPLYFQAVDESGRAVQGMRSIVYLQPGERRSCVGCHETFGTTPQSHTQVAPMRSSSRIRPGPDGTRPWSFPLLVQPVLDERCVRCHGPDESDVANKPRLTGEPSGAFTVSYENLKPYVRWYEWGCGIGGVVTRPGRMPADLSPLTEILQDANHAGKTELTESERRRLYLWLDGNSPFYGTYSQEAQQAQKQGEVVKEPVLQ